MDDATLNIADTSNVTFTFSEAPIGFTTDDVTVANGAIGNINTDNPLIQTAVYTPTNAVEDATNIINVAITWADAAGNAPVIDSNSPNYLVDTNAPRVGVGVDIITNTLFSKTATATDLGIASYAWSMISGPTDGIITFGSSTLITTTISANWAGVYVIRLTVTDNVGNIGTDDFTLTWETTAPLFKKLSPSTAYVGDVNIVIEATDETAFDLTYANNLVSLEIDNVAFAGTIGYVGSDTNDLKIQLTQSLAAGEHQIFVQIKDAAGNNKDTAFNIVVSELPDTTDPTIVVTNINTTAQGATIEADINDDFGGMLDVYAYVSITDTNNQFVAPTRTYAAGTDISYEISNLDANTDYNFTIYIRDAAENIGQDTNLFTTSVSSDDVTAPTIENLEISNIAWNGAYINADINDDSGAIMQVWLEYSVVGEEGTAVSSITYFEAGLITMAINGLDANTAYDVTLKVKDSAGNIGNDSNTFTTDVNGPITYAIDFPKSGSGFTSARFGDYLAKYELDQMTVWDVNLVLDEFLNATAGPDEERLTSDLVNVVYVYDFAGNTWETVDDANFDSWNMYDNFTSLNYVVFDLNESAIGLSIRHATVE